MNLLSGFIERHRAVAREIAELDEWERHHDDPRSGAGMALYEQAMGRDLSDEELKALWKQANALVGQRAPADYGEFLAYGYLEGRRDALVIRRHNERRAKERAVTTPSSGADVPIRRHRSPAQRLAAKPE